MPFFWLGYVLSAVAGACLFIASSVSLNHAPRARILDEVSVSLSPIVLTLTSMGDRFLAADLAAIRALVVSTEHLQAEDYAILAQWHQSAAWLNPAHEDNYYVAGAILPWNGQLAAAEDVLRKAVDARPFDPQPAFLIAFNQLQFAHDPVEGARWLLLAAERTADERQKLGLQGMASRWVGRARNRSAAIGLLRGIAEASRYVYVRNYLVKQVDRLQNLEALDRAIASFQQAFGVAPLNLEQLLEGKQLDALPIDPLGGQYAIGIDGRAVVLQGR
jgi:tetratricopeptide (TPR) repeat protein